MVDSRTHSTLPNLVIAGVAKAGTTSLFAYLAQHPDILPANLKEVRYFSSVRYGVQPPPLIEYARHFSRHAGERYLMEATPGYFFGGRRVARAMDSTLPDCRVLLIFRNPADRCWSWFRFVKSRGRIPKEMPFHEYLDRCEELHRRGVDGDHENQPFWGLGGGCYADYLDPWLDVFGERIDVRFFEHLSERPRETVVEICRWLDIDCDAPASFRFAVENKTEQYRHLPLQRAALAVNRRAGSLFLRHPLAKRYLRSAYYRVNRDPAEERPRSEDLGRLGEFYRPHNNRLARRLQDNRSHGLPGWLAEHLSD